MPANSMQPKHGSKISIADRSVLVACAFAPTLSIVWLQGYLRLSASESEKRAVACKDVAINRGPIMDHYTHIGDVQNG